MKLIEKVTTEKIQSLYDDTLIFLKNIKRVKSYEQYYELNIEWIKWLNEYVDIEIGKNIFGKDTLLHSTLVNNKIFDDYYHKYLDYFEWAEGAFIPTELDVTKAFKKGTLPAWHLPPGDFPRGIVDALKSNNKLSDNNILHIYDFEPIYELFDQLRQSKYVNIKSKIDSYFELLLALVSKTTLPELYITDTIIVEGVKVSIDYYESSYQFIADTVDDLKRSFEIMKAQGFEKAYRKTEFTLSTTDTKAKDSNIHNGKDYGKSAFYSITQNASTLLQSSIMTYNPFTTIRSIIHESGHKYYYDNMREDQRYEWDKLFQELTKKSIYSELKRDFDGFKKLLQIEFDNLIFYQTTDDLTRSEKHNLSRFDSEKQYLEYLESYYPESFNEYLGFSYNTLMEVAVDKIDGLKILPKYNSISSNQFGLFMEQLSRTLESELDLLRKKVSLFPSQYGSENASEFFAETFTAYCLRNTEYGEKNYYLDQYVFDNFLIITGVRNYKESKNHRAYRK